MRTGRPPSTRPARLLKATAPVLPVLPPPESRAGPRLLYAWHTEADQRDQLKRDPGLLPAGVHRHFRIGGAIPVPNPSATTLEGIKSQIAALHQWINSIGTNGQPATSQPADSDLSISNNTTNDVSTVGTGLLQRPQTPTCNGYEEMRLGPLLPGGSFRSPS
jgi:hypothetical protein